MLSGCGAIVSTSELTSATKALEAATEIGADRLAIYEFVSAETYLDKAREEWGRSDYQMAIDFARRSQVFAEEALERVRRGAPPQETDGSSPYGRAYDPAR